jgi:hypothetical protein
MKMKRGNEKKGMKKCAQKKTKKGFGEGKEM